MAIQKTGGSVRLKGQLFEGLQHGDSFIEITGWPTVYKDFVWIIQGLEPDQINGGGSIFMGFADLGELRQIRDLIDAEIARLEAGRIRR